MKFLAASWFPAPLVCAASLALAGPASAQLSIDIEYMRDSDPPPWEDSYGTCLTRAVDAAARYWESVFTSIPKTEIEFHYRWYNYFAHSHIGLTPSELDEWGQWAGTNRRAGALTPNKYSCDFWTFKTSGEIAWFVDDDPEEHSEFEMTPRMYNWPSDPGTLNGLASTPGDEAEVGFEGLARVFDVADSSCSGIAAGDGTDLFTVALHEMGHALGLGYRGDRDVKADGDYDVFSLVTGSLGVVAGTDSKGALDRAHLVADYALMNAGIEVGFRRLPSMIDILTIADINGWLPPTLPRTYCRGTGGSVSWDDPKTWLGFVPPTSSLGVVLYSGPPDDVFLGSSVSADGVYIGFQSTLDVGGFDLDAGERIHMDSGTSLLVDGGSLSCGALIHHGERLEILDGTLDAEKYVEADGDAEIHFGNAQLFVPGGTVRLREYSALFAEQTDARCEVLDIDGPVASLFGGRTGFSGLEELVNDGLIATLNGPLEFQPAGPDVSFDLDGDLDLSGFSESGKIDAINDSIIFGAPAKDPFDGTMRIGAGRSIKVASHLPVGGGDIQFTGDLSRLFSGDLDMFSGTVRVNGPIGTQGFIHAPQTWRFGSMADVDLGNVLHLLGDSQYRSGTVLSGLGTVRQVGDVIVYPDVAAETLIGVPRYLWDGEVIGGGGVATYSTTTVTAGAKLRITGSIASGAGDGFDGTVYVQSGAELILDQNWILEGNLVLQGGTVTGIGTITNLGTISGTGRIATTVYNDGIIVCVPPGFDWTGGALVAGSGTVQAGC